MEQVKRKKKGRPKTIYKTPGRKSKLTYELINELETLIKEGYTNQDCCAVLDVSEASFYGWINRAEEISQSEDELAKSENQIYLELVKTLKRADTQRKNDLKAKIERHGNKQWQALAWLLERGYPHEFGRLEQATKDDTPLQVQLVTLNKSNDKRLEALEKQLDEPEHRNT